MTHARLEFLRQRPPRLSDGELARHQRGGVPPARWPDDIGIYATPRTAPTFPRDYKTRRRRKPGAEHWFRLAAWAVMFAACVLIWVHGIRWLVRWLAP